MKWAKVSGENWSEQVEWEARWKERVSGFLAFSFPEPTKTKKQKQKESDSWNANKHANMHPSLYKDHTQVRVQLQLVFL